MDPALPTDEPLGGLEEVARFHGAMPAGVAVSRHGRMFVSFPKWGDDVPFTVAEIHHGRTVAYPYEAVNRTDPRDLAGTLVSVQSVVVDAADRLWILDTGRPVFAPSQYGGPKLVCVDLADDRILKTILFPPEVALPRSYLNDVRFDLRRGAEGTAFITDSSEQGPNGIVVVDLGLGESWRRLHGHPTTTASADLLIIVEGRPFSGMRMGCDGIALSADGLRLYYCPLASRRLYSVSAEALADRSMEEMDVEATVIDEGDKGGASDGLESDDAGNVYATSYEHNAVLMRSPGGQWETIAHDGRLLWPDSLSVAADGHLYVTANQLHRQASFNDGRDRRRKPYMLFRVPIDARPVAHR